MALRLNYSLTKSVPDSCGSSFLRRLANTCGVAAAHTEGVGFALSQVKKGKARRLRWHPSVHPLPGVCANHTLRMTKQYIQPQH